MGNSRTHLNFYRLNGIKSRLKKSGRSGWMTRPNQSLPYAIRLEEASKKHLVPLLWGSFPWEWDWAYISKTEDDMEKWALPLIIQAHPIMELYHHPLPTSGWFISHFLSYYFHWFRERERDGRGNCSAKHLLQRLLQQRINSPLSSFFFLLSPFPNRPR